LIGLIRVNYKQKNEEIISILNKMVGGIDVI
jgi:hypothetical protein